MPWGRRQSCGTGRVHDRSGTPLRVSHVVFRTVRAVHVRPGDAPSGLLDLSDLRVLQGLQDVLSVAAGHHAATWCPFSARTGPALVRRTSTTASYGRALPRHGRALI